MKRFALFLGILIFSASSFSCISMSSLQTAEILKQGEGRVLLGAGHYTSPAINKAVDDLETATNSTTKNDDIKLPYIEFGYRRGLSETFEIGFKYTFPGSLGVDGKFSVLNTANFDLALGLGVGYMTIETSGSSTSSDSSTNSGSGGSSTTSTSETKFKSTVMDFTVPLYASYRINESFALYSSPKYIVRSISSSETSSGLSTTSKGTQHFAGATIGTMIGSDKGVAIEVTYMKDQSSKFDIMQLGGALFW